MSHPGDGEGVFPLCRDVVILRLQAPRLPCSSLNEAVCIPLHTNTFEKGMNSTILPPARLFSLCMATSLGKEKLNLNQL